MFLLAVVMGIAAILGYCLAVYFFFYRVRFTAAWRWLGAAVGGLILAVLLAMTAFMVLWPPVNAATTIGGLLLAGAVTAVALYGGSSQKEVSLNEDLDDYQPDISSGTGS